MLNFSNKALNHNSFFLFNSTWTYSFALWPIAYQDPEYNGSLVGWSLLVSPVENPQISVEWFLSVHLFEIRQRNVSFCLWERCTLCPDFFCVPVRLNTTLWTSWHALTLTFHFSVIDEHEVQHALKHHWSICGYMGFLHTCIIILSLCNV